ncbi:MAG: alkaline phosphatase family protein [Aggregatilineales bacterium]
MSDKLIILMVDGVSADHYQRDAGRFPHLQSLERRGFRVEALRSEALGTSLPGRTSMLTGATAATSGVYGNKIWDAQRAQFRYANPDDIRVPTLPALAKAAGKRVANIGFGMIRPEDTHLFRPPWWAGMFIQRARDAAPQPADVAWLRVALHATEAEFDAACAAAGVPATLPTVDLTNEAQRAFFGLMADQQMVDWAGVIAAGLNPPDLITVEFLTTDTVQHDTGYRSELSQWAVMQADLALGRLLQRLRAAGVEDQWNIAVMSDHGHSPVERALRPGRIIPGARFQCEGQCLLVAPRDAEELARITAALAAYDAHPYPNDCIPPELRDQVVIFVAPDGTSFEEDAPPGAPDDEALGAPKAISSHGLRPGLPGDNRFALFAGPKVPAGRVKTAEAAQVAPTCAALLGLALEPFSAAPIFAPHSVPAA